MNTVCVWNWWNQRNLRPIQSNYSKYDRDECSSNHIEKRARRKETTKHGTHTHRASINVCVFIYHSFHFHIPFAALRAVKRSASPIQVLTCLYVTMTKLVYGYTVPNIIEDTYANHIFSFHQLHLNIQLYWILFTMYWSCIL